MIIHCCKVYCSRKFTQKISGEEIQLDYIRAYSGKSQVCEKPYNNFQNLYFKKSLKTKCIKELMFYGIQ